MKAAVLAAFLSDITYQVLSLLDPLKAIVSVFAPWERVVIVGSWCALLGAVTLLAGRDTARRRRWGAEICIVVVGLGVAVMHFPTSRGWHEPRWESHFPREYVIGVVEMAVCWITAALVAHWMMPNTSLERTREE